MNHLLRVSFFAVIVSALAINVAYSQKFDVKWGDNTKLKYDFDDAVPLADGNFLILKLTQKRKFGRMDYIPSLILVSKDMSEIKTEDLDMENLDNTYLKGFEKYGDNIFLMFTYYDKESKTTSFNALKIDEATLKTSKVITLGTFESDKRNDQATATYKLSADSSKVLLMVEGPWRKKETEKLYFGIFDTDLKKVWSKQVDLPIEQRYFDVYDVDVTNDSKVFLAYKHYEKEISRESVREDGSKVPSYAYKMVIYDDKNKDKEVRIDLGGKFIQGTRILSNKNGSLTISGLHKKKHNGNITGAFYATVPAGSTDVTNPKMVDFPMDLLELVDKDNYASTKSSDPGLYSNFRMRHILERENGSVDLISEYYKLVISTYTDSKTGRTTTTYHYYYGDIVNTNISTDGKATFTRIPKNQKMVNADLFLGFFPIVYHDKLVLIYNDDKDNIERDLEKKPDDVMKFKKAVLAAATIDSKGTLTRQAIFSNDDEDYVTVPRFSSRIAADKYLITSDLLKLFKKRTRFGVITVK